MAHYKVTVAAIQMMTNSVMLEDVRDILCILDLGRSMNRVQTPV